MPLFIHNKCLLGMKHVSVATGILGNTERESPVLGFCTGLVPALLVQGPLMDLADSVTIS